MNYNKNIVRIMSTCTVVPPSRPRCRCHLTPCDLFFLSLHYIELGFLFRSSNNLTPTQIIQRLKSSLATTLGYYYPAAGRLAIETSLNENGNPRGMSVSIGCNGQGAEFVHAVADGVTVEQVEAIGKDVPPFLHLFFPLDGVVNYEGYTRPLVAVQLTELADGFFVACSYNHCVSDGIAFERFLNAWAEIARTGKLHYCPDNLKVDVDVNEVYRRWFGSKNCIPSSPIMLPYTHHNQFKCNIPTPNCRERVFHLSAHSVAALKATVNREHQNNNNSNNIIISSFESVASLVWRAVTRARGHQDDTPVLCSLPIDIRSRLKPPLPAHYMGNSIYLTTVMTSANELLSNGLGFGAWLIHKVIAQQSDNMVRGALEELTSGPVIRTLENNMTGVLLGSSPRFDFHGCDFGWGKAVELFRGNSNKTCGLGVFYGGREGGGSMELRICLEGEAMAHLENDEEFMAHFNILVSSSMLRAKL